MKASARNQWLGEIVGINIGAVTSEVIIHVAAGATLVAHVAHETAKTMELSFGKEVLALVKASMIILVTDVEGYRLSPQNQLSGKVVNIKQGLVTADVTLELDGGVRVVASITFESAETLGLQVGMPATAIFEAASVMLGARKD